MESTLTPEKENSVRILPHCWAHCVPFQHDHLAEVTAGGFPVRQQQGLPSKGQAFPVLTFSAEARYPQQTGSHEAGKRTQVFLDMNPTWALATPKWEAKVLPRGGQAGVMQGNSQCRDLTLKSFRPANFCVSFPNPTTGSLPKHVLLG